MTSTKFIKEIELLLQTIQDINSSNVKGENILHECVKRYGRVDVVEFLQSKGADLHSKTTNYGKNVIHLAIESIKKKNWNSIQKLIKYLIEQKVNVNACDWSGDTALHYVVRNCTNVVHSIPLIDLLIKSGVLIDASNNVGQTALHFAVELDNYALSEYLISVGASVDCKTKQLKSALQISVEKCNYKMSKLLIQNSATVNCMMDEEGSLLHIAINSSSAGDLRIDLLKLLLENGADINSCDAAQSTPLHLVLQDKDECCADFLIGQNSSVDCRNKKNETPLRIAIRNKMENSVRFLLAKGANPNVTEVELESGVIDCRKSLMYDAVCSGNFTIVQLLSEYGADFSSKHDVVGYYLCISVTFNNVAMVQFFLSKGADINFEKKGKTPLSCALGITKDVPEDTVQFLIDNGAKVIEGSPLSEFRGHCERNALCVIRHLALLSYQDIYIGMANLSALEKIPRHQKYYLSCINELRLMSTHYISCFNVTLYDILKDRKHEFDEFFQYDLTVKLIKSDKIASKYPKYCWNLWYKLTQLKKRSESMDKGKRFFSSVWIGTKIPDGIVTVICEYLSNDDLENLEQASILRKITCTVTLRDRRKRKILRRD
ncbi:hypothetical protein QAD02_010991 [Eretmocerus hayati]|uniref:Uncharacterized protein n=1 Tax=Eretmocerus hayati TaxID=131215 RepID=A0ACC2NVD1_9HYME|nr:hypothetical protein QAD02_010991 [Eretmocerus hayati]